MLGFFQCSPLITSDSDLLCCFSKMYYIYIWVTRRKSYQKQELVILRDQLDSLMFSFECVWGGRERERERLLIILVFCVVLCLYLLFVFALCLVCPILPVSLDCPFLIASSFFSNVYLYIPLITTDGELCS